MHFRLSSHLAKSVKTKCRTISDHYADYRRNRKIAKSQSPRNQHGASDPPAPPSCRGDAAGPWKGEPYRFASDPDDWDKNLESDSGPDLYSGYRLSVEEEDLGRGYYFGA